MRESGGISDAWRTRAAENEVFRALMERDPPDVRAARFERGEAIARRDEPLRALYFPVAGTVKVSLTTERGQSLLIAFYRACGVLGDVELLDGGGASTWVDAVTDVVCLAVRMDACRARVQTDVRLALALARSLGEKLRRCTDESAARALTPLPERLLTYLRSAAPDGWLAEPLTAAAESMGVSYRHLMRAMRVLEDAGSLGRAGGRVWVRADGELPRGDA